MLPKTRRIERSDFAHILKQGKRYNSPHLFLYISKMEEKNTSQHSRFSFSASKKVAKLATDRNRLRRQGYSALSAHLDKVKNGFFGFFSFKKIPNNFSVLEKEILELLKTSFVLS